MKVVLLAGAAAAGWLLWRRRKSVGQRVRVAWQDGAELELRAGTPAHGHLVSLAGRALR